MGANAIIGVTFDSSELMNLMTEILAYDTAAVVEKETQLAASVRLT